MKKVLLSIFVLIVVGVVNIKLSNNFCISTQILSSTEALAQSETPIPSCSCSKTCKDGKTVASCTGYQNCNCNSGSYTVVCDGVSSTCMY